LGYLLLFDDEMRQDSNRKMLICLLINFILEITRGFTKDKCILIILKIQGVPELAPQRKKGALGRIY
jgi:hypothetical protein